MNDIEIKSIDYKRKATHMSIPLEFIDNPEYDFSPIELLLISVINSFMEPPDYCFASNEYFAKKFNVSEVTISKAINRLIAKGYVQKLSFDGRNRKIACFINTELGNKRKRLKEG